MSNVLIINGHPHPQSSVAGQAVLAALTEKLPNAVVRTLADTVGSDGFNVTEEQNALRQADAIIIQFPFYWYSVPGLLKEWFDTVLTHGFAFGESGRELEGKKLVFSFTTGAAAQHYVTGGSMGWPVEAFLPPLLQTAALCHIPDARCVWSNGMQCWTEEDRKRIGEAARDHAERVCQAMN